MYQQEHNYAPAREHALYVPRSPPRPRPPPPITRLALVHARDDSGKIRVTREPLADPRSTKLHEIDRIISRTLAYVIVTGLLVGVYTGLVLLATENRVREAWVAGRLRSLRNGGVSGAALPPPS